MPPPKANPRAVAGGWLRPAAVLLALASCRTSAPAGVGDPTPLDLGSIPQGPEGDAFYTPPSPLPSGSNGAVVWARALKGAGALPSAAHNLLVLYRTTSVVGAAVAVTGAVAIPRGLPPDGGWPVISWDHGTTGNAPQCAPTRDTSPNEEQRMLDGWVARGYVVLQTDYEGEGTPGIHPYFVGAAAGRDTADMVRAARALDADIGPRWVVMGHSEGGHAALFTAAVAAGWAPELKLLGAVAVAPASHITASLMGTYQTSLPAPFLPFLIMMVQGMSTADPGLHLEQILSASGLARLPDLQRKCLGEVLDDPAWVGVPASSFFHPQVDIRPLEQDFLANEPGALRLHIPVLLVQGEEDNVVTPTMTVALSDDLCQRGATVEYRNYPGEDHDSVLDASVRYAQKWVEARFRGESPPSSCR